MDTLPLATSFLKPILWLLPLFLLIAFLKSSTFKGWFGEWLVSRKASRRLPPGIYREYHNVTIPDESGTTQIDHIYVSRFGVFVVETKHMSGWIFGGERQSQWTQNIYGNKQKFQNPILQNYKHLKTLESLLQLPLSKLHTVLVFTGDSTFKTDLPACVCRLANFTDYIRSFAVPVMADSDVLDVCRKIEDGRLTANRATHRAHVRHLRDRHRL
jgi:hypothetical protein